MPTIVERANKYAEEESGSNYIGAILRYGGYVKGATEQHKIDINKACEYLRNNIDTKLVIYHNDSWCSLEQFIGKFRKAMEE